MIENNIKDLIIKLNDKKRFEGDYLAKFLIFWICFNAWIAYRSGKDKDRDMIECLSNKDSKMNDLITAYDNAWRDKQAIFISNIKRLVSKNREDPKRIRLRVQGKMLPVEIKDEKDFANIVKAIYGIRCSLFHGSMDVNDSENKELVNIAQNILNTWIDYLIRGWKN